MNTSNNSSGGTNPTWYCNVGENIHINCVHKEAAQQFGKLGGDARAKKHNKETLSAIGKKGAESRWGKKRKQHVPSGRAEEKI